MRANYRVNSGVRFEVLSKDQLQEMFDGVLHLMDKIGLDNPEALFEVIDRHPGVRGVLWGHVHQTYEGERNGVRLMASPSTCVQFLPGQDGFGIDNLPPGLRWLELMPTGIIRSGIHRLSRTPVKLDLQSNGY